jgi:hypothetical protein
VIVFTNSITHRLTYIAGFLGKQLTGKPFLVTDKLSEFENYTDPKINYSEKRITVNEYWIVPHSLLFEETIQPQSINCFEVNGNKAFFKTTGDFPFDIFAAAFYLLSRYEEYLPHEKDEYGRYDYKNAIAFKENFLHLPLINTWIESFKESLKEKFPLFTVHHSPFTFLPTYDIDEAWSFKHKQWWRSAGAAVRDLVRGRWKNFSFRRSVLNNKATDPYDSYEWMDNLHREYKLKPVYFFLVAAKNGIYDKNILPTETDLQTLIRKHSEKYSVGIHPSWRSGDEPALLKQEKESLEKITTKKITASRQHYIRFTLPHTFRHLIDAGIKEDFSMGYGSINGFRASAASPFYWYDLEKEEQTYLLLYPYCFMDANAYYEQKLTAQQALEEMQHYYQEVKKVNGTLSMIWHNNFFGTEERFHGWKEVYRKFIGEIIDKQ